MMTDDALDLTQGTPGPNVSTVHDTIPYHAYGPIVATTAREVALLRRCVALEGALARLVQSAAPVIHSDQYTVPMHWIRNGADLLDFGWWKQEGF